MRFSGRKPPYDFMIMSTQSGDAGFLEFRAGAFSRLSVRHARGQNGSLLRSANPVIRLASNRSVQTVSQGQSSTKH